MVYKSGQIFLPFCHNPRVWRTDRQTDKQTDGRTEFSSLDRVCIPCSAVKTQCSPLTSRRKRQCWRFWETFSVQWTVLLLWHSLTCPLRSIPSIMWHCCSGCGFRTVSAAVYTTGSSLSAVGFSLSAVAEARRLQLGCYEESHKDRSLDRFYFCYTLWVKKNWATFIFTVTLSNFGRF